jgi:hypothetical protein
MLDKFNCDIHGFLSGESIRIITIKKREYIRCKLCQKEKDKKYSKNYRDKNKEYYKNKKTEHYKEKPEMQKERNKRYRDKKLKSSPK